MSLRASVLLLLSLELLLCMGRAHGCLNDRDSDGFEAEPSSPSPAQQAKDLPDVVQVITGRFERNPLLFYQMRVTRVAAELKADPTKLGLYDDAAVACDRMGRDDEAIAWIEKKHHCLPPLQAGNAALKEAWYRYYANVGTFRAHRWLRAGASRARLVEVERARDEIAEAIRLKPNAHLGREKYQLQVLQWIIHPALPGEEGEPPASLGYYLDNPITTIPASEWSASSASQMDTKLKDLVRGLSGLIVLGNAWQSMDIFDALTESLDKSDKGTLAYLAQLRRQEIQAAGGHTLAPPADFYEVGELNEPNTQDLQRLYHHLRVEAEQWQQQRTAFMMPRLRAGRHPDTDPTFWQGYQNMPPPTLDIPWYTPAGRQSDNRPAFWVWASAFSLIGLAGLFALKRLRLKRHMKRQALL